MPKDDFLPLMIPGYAAHADLDVRNHDLPGYLVLMRPNAKMDTFHVGFLEEIDFPETMGKTWENDSHKHST